MLERAQRIASCANMKADLPSQPSSAGHSCCTASGKCGPFYNQLPLPLNSPCYCSTPAGPMAGQVCQP
jgi:hypothetical protein